VRPPRVLQTTTFRLAAIYVAGFAVSVAALGVVIYFVTAEALERRLDTRIAVDAQMLQRNYQSGGLNGLITAVRTHEHTHPNGALEYAVISDGRRIVGQLSQWPAGPGWSTSTYAEREGEEGRRRFLVEDLGGEVRLVVAADPEQVDEVEEAIFDGFLSAFGAVLLLGIGGGLGLSLALLRRVEAIRRTAEAIIAGDLSRRVPVRGSGDDLDRLSQTLNQMLDRITELMESLREVSANIAHDLKTPLARLRRRLETARTQAHDERAVALESAVAQIDEILATFSALLRIAQIEAGTRRAAFARVNLSELFGIVAEAFAPAAEDAGQALTTSITPNLHFIGDRELLTQMLANLIENAIRHTGTGTTISVDLHSDAEGIVGSVSDNGPGVPVAERGLIFQRFHRLPQSQSVPGSGLGLSLVKAVAAIHAIAVRVEDAAPGLRIRMRFPLRLLEAKRSASDKSNPSEGNDQNATHHLISALETYPRKFRSKLPQLRPLSSGRVGIVLA
jgi:signal transduction histidine kinase